MADDKSVNLVMDCADLKTYYRKHDGTDDRGIRGLPRGPASGRYGTLPLSMLERVGFRVSHTISAEEKGGLHEISCQYAGDLP